MLRAQLVVATCVALASGIPLLCTSQSQANPIVDQYPNEVTGTINGTTAVIPIPYDVARSIIPAQYGILTKAYKEVFPSIPDGMYPASLEALQDHDVRNGAVGIPDFSVRSLQFSFAITVYD